MNNECIYLKVMGLMPICEIEALAIKHTRVYSSVLLRSV